MSKYPKTGLQGNSPAELHWFGGVWQGHRGDDPIEEHWSSLAGNALMGMFRWQKAERIWFYEFMTIEEQEGQVLLRIKHFYPGLKGWEEKDQSAEFLLVQYQPNEAVFLHTNKQDGAWLVYRRTAEQLHVFFEREEADADPEKCFIYQLQSAETVEATS